MAPAALLSARKFSIADWMMIEGKAADVVEMDWRTVTLVTTGRPAEWK
jgi:small-conductance mechanosensitive channel